MTQDRPINVIAIDISGSTSGSSFYYQNVQRILEQYYNESFIIIEWNGDASKASRSQIQDRINKRSGTGWTSPSAIIKHLTSLNITNINHFILVTDGEVGTNEVDSCDKEIQFQHMTFQQFDGFIIGSKKYANMSVTCPFTRSCRHTITQIEPGLEPEQIASISDEDLAIMEQIKTIDSLDEFMRLYPTIERVFAARLLGTVGDQELRKEVVKMQQRITANMAKDTTKVDESQLLMKFIEAGDMANALNLASKFLQIQNTEYEKCINALIRMCDGGLRQIFDSSQIKSFRAKIADTAQEVETTEIDDVPTDVQTTFECPISYENETDPVILISRPDQPILNMIDNKNSTDAVINCPLDIFFQKDPLEAMKSCIDHPLSLKSMREAEACNQPIVVSPLTRKKLIGGIPLGASEEHVKAADWTLFQLTSGGKRLGNPDMWFAVLWMMLERNMFPYLKDVLPFVREQMIFRLRNHMTSASLSGLSTFCQRRLPLAGACWFCLSSPFFITEMTKNQNMLRFHLPHAQILRKMTGLVNYTFPEGFDRLYNRSIVFSALLRFKRNNPALFNILIRCLYQNSVCVVVDEQKHIIPVDGEATAESREAVLQLLPPACRKVDPAELVWLSKFVDVGKSATDNQFPLTEDAEPLPKADVNWPEIDSKYQLFEKVEIDPTTMRPFKIIDGINWKDIYAMKFGSTANVLIGLDSMFCQFVEGHSRYPTPGEYIVAYASRIFNMQNPMSTLPARIVEIVEFRISAFQRAIGEANINQPIEVAIRFAGSSPVGLRKNFHFYFTEE